MVLWQQIFFDFGSDDFPSKIPFEKCSKIVVFRFGVEIRFCTCKSLQIVESSRVVLVCFASQCLPITVEWLRQGPSLLQLHA